MFQFTPMVRNLLLLNVAMLLLEQTHLLGNLPDLLALYPWTSPRFLVFQHLTYMFMHGGFGHLFSNMLGLLIFGPLLENRWGPRRFLTFWVVCGIGAGVLYAGVRHYELEQMREARNAFVEAPSGIKYSDFFYDNLPGYFSEEDQDLARALQKDPGNAAYVQTATRTLDDIYDGANNSPMVGASGALFAIILAFAYLFPNTEVMVPPVYFPIKAKYVALFYGVLELYSGVHRTPGDNVAHFAHLGGMLFGFLLLKYWERNRARFY
jgi:membrane associated rhomboid family serine protease